MLQEGVKMINQSISIVITKKIQENVGFGLRKSCFLSEKGSCNVRNAFMTKRVGSQNQWDDKECMLFVCCRCVAVVNVLVRLWDASPKAAISTTTTSVQLKKVSHKERDALSNKQHLGRVNIFANCYQKFPLEKVLCFKTG